MEDPPLYGRGMLGEDPRGYLPPGAQPSIASPSGYVWNSLDALSRIPGDLQRLYQRAQDAPLETGASLLGSLPASRLGAEGMPLLMAAGAMMRNARLPMDTASRFARADEQGYRRVFHGTADDVPAFQNPHGGEPGHFVSPDPQIAGQYPFGTSRRVYPEEGRNVMPLMLRGRTFDVNAPVSDAAVAGWRTAILEQVPARMRDNVGREFDAIIANAPVEMRGPMIDRYLRVRAPVRYEPLMRQQGYIGVDRGAEIQVFDPQNLRSVHAAFDPAQQGSSNLLASRWWSAPAGGAAVGGGLLGGNQQ